eukprot:TRINITY_DN13071_c0_g1_i1.p1 TRINITY_DN13071_c0_g1~~TRINITY_DN13071_c0_g1_i1.p1  ORF type:complete len:218 (-),score=20.89 TRINITY_DN13071_c0_g1_i1:112-765(-)
MRNNLIEAENPNDKSLNNNAAGLGDVSFIKSITVARDSHSRGNSVGKVRTKNLQSLSPTRVKEEHGKLANSVPMKEAPRVVNKLRMRNSSRTKEKSETIDVSDYYVKPKFLEGPVFVRPVTLSRKYWVEEIKSNLLSKLSGDDQVPLTKLTAFNLSVVNGLDISDEILRNSSHFRTLLNAQDHFVEEVQVQYSTVCNAPMRLVSALFLILSISLKYC